MTGMPIGHESNPYAAGSFESTQFETHRTLSVDEIIALARRDETPPLITQAEGRELLRWIGVPLPRNTELDGPPEGAE